MGSSGGTDNPALLVLKSKGYAFRVICYRLGNKAKCLYIAEKERRSFVGDSGAELLGLVAIWEHFGDDWNHQEPNVMTDVIENVESDDEDE